MSPRGETASIRLTAEAGMVIAGGLVPIAAAVAGTVFFNETATTETQRWGRRGSIASSHCQPGTGWPESSHSISTRGGEGSASMVGLKSVRLATSAAILPTEMLKKPLPLGANFRKSPAAALIGEASARFNSQP